MLVRQRVQEGVRLALAVDGELQVGQRVVTVGVAAVLGDEQLGPERGEPRGTTRANARSQPRVVGARGQRDVDGRALGAGAADVVGSPVPGKSVRPDSCSEIVSTRGSSQKAASTPSPWCTSTST